MAVEAERFGDGEAAVEEDFLEAIKRRGFVFAANKSSEKRI